MRLYYMRLYYEIVVTTPSLLPLSLIKSSLHVVTRPVAQALGEVLQTRPVAPNDHPTITPMIRHSLRCAGARANDYGGGVYVLFYCLPARVQRPTLQALIHCVGTRISQLWPRWNVAVGYHHLISYASHVDVEPLLQEGCDVHLRDTVEHQRAHIVP